MAEDALVHQPRSISASGAAGAPRVGPRPGRRGGRGGGGGGAGGPDRGHLPGRRRSAGRLLAGVSLAVLACAPALGSGLYRTLLIRAVFPWANAGRPGG